MKGIKITFSISNKTYRNDALINNGIDCGIESEKAMKDLCEWIRKENYKSSTSWPLYRNRYEIEERVDEEDTMENIVTIWAGCSGSLMALMNTPEWKTLSAHIRLA